MDDIQRPILIVDVLNLFIRSWCAYPTMSQNGYQMGGCVGFLKTLNKLVRENSPKAVYLAWESGGSQRRRSLYSEYKMNRRPEKLNRFYGDDIPDSEENKKHQMIVLLGMLKCVPVCQLYVPDCEGDDVIAYLCRITFLNELKVIASSDKDMYQLLNERTRVYNLHKKIYTMPEDVVEEFRVQPHNFALAKALCGDHSDNIPGVKGVGFKTATRVLPFLSLEDLVTLDDVISYCNVHSDESAIYRRIIECEVDIRRNWKLVYLDGGMLSAHQASKIDNLTNTFVPIVDRMALIKLLLKEGINDFDVFDFCNQFTCIEGVQQKT